jgi:hypothetical protein
MNKLPSIFLIFLTLVSCTKKEEETPVVEAPLVVSTPPVAEPEIEVITIPDYKINQEYDGEYAEVQGLYFADSIQIIEKQDISHRDGFAVLDKFETIKNNIYLIITYIEDDWFNIAYNFPFYGSANPDYNKAKFQFPPDVELPFCRLEADRGGGGTSIKMYLIENSILLDLDYNFNPNMEEGDNYAIESFKCKITFQKSL